jgi:hypothetical protein
MKFTIGVASSLNKIKISTLSRLVIAVLLVANLLYIRILTKEPTNQHVSFEDGRMLRTSSSSGNGYPYYIGVLLYEGDNIDANHSATMMKKLNKVINPELKWHMDNNNKKSYRRCAP